MDEPTKRGRGRPAQTIASLRLDLQAATEGKTWLLMPEGFRGQECGKTYPLPTSIVELQQLIAIPMPEGKVDSGCIYIRRAIDRWREKTRHRQSAALFSESNTQQVKEMRENFRISVKNAKVALKESVAEVRTEALQAIASLSGIFELVKRGLDGQMRAHLDGAEWRGERIDAKAARDCFRMVTQAVKGLGLPSDDRKDASDSIMKEVAAAIEATRGATEMSATDDEVEH